MSPAGVAARYYDFLSNYRRRNQQQSPTKPGRDESGIRAASGLALLSSPAMPLRACSEISGHMWIPMSRAARRRYWLLVAIVCAAAAAAIVMSAMQGSVAAESLASAATVVR
jgi:hypothetical protein